MKNSTIKIIGITVVAVVVAGLAWKYWPSGKSEASATNPNTPKSEGNPTVSEIDSNFDSDLDISKQKEGKVENMVRICDQEYYTDTSRKIVLSGQQLRNIPDTVSKFTNLEVFKLSKTDVNSLPHWFAKLRNLKKVILEFNKFGSNGLDSVKVLASLPNLEDLSLKYNCLTDKDITSLTAIKKLARLDISGNIEIKDIESLKTLANIKTMTKLIISTNSWLDKTGILQIVDSLPESHSLQELIIRDNRLTDQDKNEIIQKAKKQNLRVGFKLFDEGFVGIGGQ